MGLSRSSIAFLMAEAARRPFSGRILMLGLQGLLITEEEIEEVAHEQGVKLRDAPETIRQRTLQPGCASADYLFYRLGFHSLPRRPEGDQRVTPIRHLLHAYFVSLV